MCEAGSIYETPSGVCRQRRKCRCGVNAISVFFPFFLSFLFFSLSLFFCTKEPPTDVHPACNPPTRHSRARQAPAAETRRSSGGKGARSRGRARGRTPRSRAAESGVPIWTSGRVQFPSSSLQPEERLDGGGRRRSRGAAAARRRQPADKSEAASQEEAAAGKRATKADSIQRRRAAAARAAP